MKNTKSKFFFDNENTRVFFTMAKYSIESHIEFFHTDIIHNEFVIDDNTDHTAKELNKYIDLYCYSKKILNILKRFCRNIKFKKYKKYQMDTDLYFNKLNTFPNNQKITLLENDTLYTFRLSDIMVIIKDSLSITDGLFPLPKKAKNPYTNISLSKHNLYNIYFALLNSTFHIPLLINKFFLSGFNITILLNRFYPYLKDLCIKKFMLEGSVIDQYGYIENMFFEYRKEINYFYIPNKDSLSYARIINYCKKLNKSLYNYLMYKYSNNNWTKDKYNNTSLDILKQFIETNPDLIYVSQVSSSTDNTRRRRMGLSHIIPPPPPTTPPTIPRLRMPQINPPPPTINNRINTRINNYVERRNALHDLVEEIDLQIINSSAVHPFMPSRQIPRTPTH